MNILVINGPNLNLLGKRRPDIYGNRSLHDLEFMLRSKFPSVSFSFVQSNSEGDIIDAIHNIGFSNEMVGIVINPGAYAHYSYAIADALESVPCPAVEVHISNIAAREEFRRTSVTAAQCVGVISGLGFDGYSAAVRFLIERSNE